MSSEWKLVPREIDRLSCRMMLHEWNEAMMKSETLEMLWPRLVSAAPQPPAADNRTALDQFKEYGAEEVSDPVERLRVFCSFAMAGQDWLDVEPFFDALVTKPPADIVLPPLPDWITPKTGWANEFEDYARAAVLMDRERR